MTTINPDYLAAYFSPQTIEDKITALMDSITDAEASSMDDFSDTQAAQKIKKQNLDSLYAALELWIKAALIQSDDPSTKATIIAARYTGRRPLPSISGITT